MVDQLAELLRSLGPDLGDHRDHPLPAQFGAEVIIIVVRRLDAHRAVERAEAAARGHRRRRLVLDLGEQLGHAHAEAAAQLLQAVVGQCEPVMLDLRQRRDRDAAMVAHLLERPAVARPKAAQQRAERGLIALHAVAAPSTGR